jgi:uncharacterized protein YggE
VHTRAAAAVVLIALGVAPAAVADAATTSQTLTVDGQGSVMVKPNSASVSVTVTRFASTSAPALSATNKTVQAVVSAVEGAGVPTSGVQTDSVNLSCARVRVGPKGHKHSIRRCTASQSVSITSPASIVGHVIDAATGAGATNISGPDYSFSDPSAGEVAAEKAAIADAQQQANAAAAQLGCVVTGVQSINLNPGGGASASGGTSTPVYSAAPSTPTKLHPGRQEVDATVAVVFTIAPATPAS